MKPDAKPLLVVPERRRSPEELRRRETLRRVPEVRSEEVVGERAEAEELAKQLSALRAEVEQGRLAEQARVAEADQQRDAAVREARAAAVE